MIGIVLAAGEGRRMGRAKARLELDGTTLVDLHVARLHEVGATEVLVVVREAIRSQARVLVAETRSQAESLAIATAALATTDAVLVTPVDLLPPEPATYRALLAALRDGCDAVTPTFGGKGGHPVVLRPAVLAPFREKEPPPLKLVLDALGPRRLRLRVDDARVLGDFDTPSDWAARVVTSVGR